MQERLRPELALPELILDDLANLRISDIEEAADVGRVVIDDPRMCVEDVHSGQTCSSDALKGKSRLPVCLAKWTLKGVVSRPEQRYNRDSSPEPKNDRQ